MRCLVVAALMVVAACSDGRTSSCVGASCDAALPDAGLRCDLCHPICLTPTAPAPERPTVYPTATDTSSIMCAGNAWCRACEPERCAPFAPDGLSQRPICASLNNLVCAEGGEDVPSPTQHSARCVAPDAGPPRPDASIDAGTFTDLPPPTDAGASTD